MNFDTVFDEIARISMAHKTREAAEVPAPAATPVQEKELDFRLSALAVTQIEGLDVEVPKVSSRI